MKPVSPSAQLIVTSLAVLDQVERVAGADHGRHAELARDDRGVAGAAAAIGDDRRRRASSPAPSRDRSCRRPARRRAARGSCRRAMRTTRATPLPIFWPIARPSAMTSPRCDERVALDLGGVAARLHRFRPRLHDEQLAADAVLRPLDVHRAAVVLLDHQRLLRQLMHVGIADRERVAQLGRRFLGAHALAGLVRIHHAHLLGAERATQDRRLALRAASACRRRTRRD